MIKLYNRATKEYEIEKVAGEGLMKHLYSTTLGKLQLEFLIKRKLYSALTGVLCDTRLSAGKIQWFAKEYGIDLSLCEEGVENFKSFNHFFTRKLKPEARPFAADTELLLSPGDGRMRAWMDIDMEKLVQVKGLSYSLKNLLADEQLASQYQGGIYVLLRLAPVDYHRFHFIDNGICTASKKIKGYYYSVNPIALSTIPTVFCQNKREYSILDSEHFGKILYMEVGATSVGSIVQTYQPGAEIRRGDEKGYFKFGGSTVILFLEKDVACIDEEIIEQTALGFETRVLAGEPIGKSFNG